MPADSPKVARESAGMVLQHVSFLRREIDYDKGLNKSKHKPHLVGYDYSSLS